MKNLIDKINVDFVKNKINSKKVRDHCHLTGKQAEFELFKKVFLRFHRKKNFNPFIFLNFSNYFYHLFFEKLVDKKMMK